MKALSTAVVLGLLAAACGGSSSPPPSTTPPPATSTNPCATALTEAETDAVLIKQVQTVLDATQPAVAMLAQRGTGRIATRLDLINYFRIAP